jgi:hypothetical protein
MDNGRPHSLLNRTCKSARPLPTNFPFLIRLIGQTRTTKHPKSLSLILLRHSGITKDCAKIEVL